MVKILVVEDNQNYRKLIAARLKQEGYEIYQSSDGKAALDQLDTRMVDLIICDVMMPNLDGYEFTKSLRDEKENVPILMITAKDTFRDKKIGFDVGIDDYMVKPIDMNEMVLRVSALLRRSQIMTENQLVFGKVLLDYDALTVSVDGEVTELPKKEFYLLFKLLSYPKKIFTRQQLMDDIWGIDSEADDRTVDAHIKKLRKKFEQVEAFKIITIRGLGYKAEKYL